MKDKSDSKVRFIAALSSICISLAFFACFSLDADAAVVDRIVAVVNNDVVTEVQLNRAMAARSRNGGKTQPDPVARQDILDRLINDRLINQLMSSSKIEVTDDDLANAIANVLKQNGMTIEQLRTEVTAKGMTYEDYKKELAMEIRRIKFINQVIGPRVKITDQDLRDYYQRNQDHFRGGVRAHIAQIFLPFEGITTEAEAEQLKQTALSIVSRSRKGTSFAELVKSYSKGPNAEQGGDLGMVSLKDLPTPVADTIRNMRVGDVSYPILTENGLVIVKLISLPELSASDFDDLRDRIYSAVYDERIKETMDSYLDKERQKAFVEIR